MKTFKEFISEQDQIEEGLRQKVIGGAALVAGILGALGHSSNEEEYRDHLKAIYGDKNPSISKIVKYHTNQKYKPEDE